MQRYLRIKVSFLSIFVQLISAGVLDKADYPDFDEETGILPKDDDSGKLNDWSPRPQMHDNTLL